MTVRLNKSASCESVVKNGGRKNDRQQMALFSGVFSAPHLHAHMHNVERVYSATANSSTKVKGKLENVGHKCI